MKAKLDFAFQAILGLIFFVFGLNFFLGFLPVPQPSGDAATFMGGLFAAGYFFPLLKVVEIVAGALLLVRRFSALALVLLAPIVVQIFLYHAFLDPQGLPLSIVIVLLEAYLGLGVYGASFKGILRPDSGL